LKSHNPLADYRVVLHYKKGSDVMAFRSKEKADAAITKLKEDVRANGYGFVTFTDDDDNTVDFLANDFVRAVTKAPRI